MFMAGPSGAGGGRRCQPSAFAASAHCAGRAASGSSTMSSTPVRRFVAAAT